MGALIEDYALIGDTQTCALVSRDGAVDWLCVPRFDSPACFSALLGDSNNGRWRITPVHQVRSMSRTYRGDTLVLETEYVTDTGTVALIDFMPVRDDQDPSVIRIVEGRAGKVSMAMGLVIRFDYGSTIPWVQSVPGGIDAVGGADGLTLHTSVPVRGQDYTTMGLFDVHAGERVPFTLTWHPSYRPAPPEFSADRALDETEAWWRNWSAGSSYDGLWKRQVMRSLITLKALTFAPSGGIVAAATTSLPEYIGGVRNWDYRYCWLRDATFALNALLDAGYDDEAEAWALWLRRAVAGHPGALQIMYGVTGERRLTETELDWLDGYEDSKPVRVGNAASDQFQLDVYGEVLDMFHTVLDGKGLSNNSLNLIRAIVQHVARVWVDPDDGIWEIRGTRRHFVHSKVMAWVAIDRWVKIIERLGLDDPVEQWRDLRDEIHREVSEKGYNPALQSFTQYYGSDQLDASLLMLGLVGFLPPSDPRLVGTIEAVQRELLVDGFVLRYRTDVRPGADTDRPLDSQQAEATDKGAVADTVDGLPPGEGSFLLTTFWLVDNLVLIGRIHEARELFEKLLGLANDVGLLAEEYDVAASRFVGNFPQAFSHIGVVNSAANLSGAARTALGPLARRAGLHRHAPAGTESAEAASAAGLPTDPPSAHRPVTDPTAGRPADDGPPDLTTAG